MQMFLLVVYLVAVLYARFGMGRVVWKLKNEMKLHLTTRRAFLTL